MAPLHRRLFRLATGRSRARDDFEAELDTHLAMVEDELRAAGHSAEEARLLARRQVGDRRRLTAEVVAIDRQREREEQRGERMARWLLDLRLALRGLYRDPWFALAAIGLVGLGVAVNVGVFSVVNAAFVRALPYPGSERIVTVRETREGRPMAVAGLNFLDWQAMGRGFTSMSAYWTSSATLVAGERPEKIRLAFVSGDFAAVLGVVPMAGRWFSADELVPGGPRAAVISRRLWRDRFGADAGLIGSVVRVDGQAVEVIGVMPPSMDFPVGIDLWAAANLVDGAESRTSHNWRVIGRLEPGAALIDVQTGLSELTRRITAGETRSEFVADGVVLTPLRTALLGQSPRLLGLLQAAVGLLLVIALLNLTTLLLARAARRHGEVALTLALGAGRGDLVRRFVVESLVLTTFGSAAGLLAWLAVRPAVLGPVGQAVPFVRSLPLDAVVLAALFGLIVVVGVLGGLLPGLWASRARARLAGGGEGRVVSAAGPMRTLIALEVAATFTLLATAVLLGRSLGRMLDQPLGFDPSGRLLVSVDLPTQEGSPYRDHDRFRLFVDQLESRVRALPGVSRVAVGNGIPLVGSSPNGSARILGEPSGAGGPAAVSDLRLVGPGLFETLDVPLRAGRGFQPEDRSDGAYVVVVNEAFARVHLRGESPIGRQVRFPGMDWTGDDRWATVVGMVGDVRQDGPGSESPPAIYYDYRQRPQPYRTLHLVFSAGPGAAAGALDGVRRILTVLDPTVPFAGGPFEDVLMGVVAQPRLRAVVVGGFALAALLLAGIGLFGVVGFVVLQRTREFGVRIALGASSRHVALAAVSQAVAPVVAGLVVGGLISLITGRLVGGFLFEVSSADPVALALAAGAVLLVATAACVAPIRRALCVDPARALRPE